ncbi:hypothetical protein DL766_009466 [Monosporascus sp. MC13-8B]|uniref:RING-type domain-containing protein n=1 Tax=Monosporascus cannonballus TaxID=155416 RepID=A0ABY0GXZ5_9PEZI|nr:hypothetical protein DL763_010833 [Monosporascus cannonballus]RYO80084.1 hypothetical protein DL762_007841 [Monosporascus cannonballus]RYP15196.1 hypothetical protein DL766_009466 [Monosporascus sp. MC13-8B]
MDPECCSICYAADGSETRLTTTPCGHIFCLECIKAWLVHTDTEASCPYCRSKLVHTCGCPLDLDLFNPGMVQKRALSQECLFCRAVRLWAEYVCAHRDALYHNGYDGYSPYPLADFDQRVADDMSILSSVRRLTPKEYSRMRNYLVDTRSYVKTDKNRIGRLFRTFYRLESAGYFQLEGSEELAELRYLCGCPWLGDIVYSPENETTTSLVLDLMGNLDKQLLKFLWRRRAYIGIHVEVWEILSLHIRHRHRSNSTRATEQPPPTRTPKIPFCEAPSASVTGFRRRLLRKILHNRQGQSVHLASVVVAISIVVYSALISIL